MTHTIAHMAAMNKTNRTRKVVGKTDQRTEAEKKSGQELANK